MFPADDILIARGKYTTLSRERGAQVRRVQEICTTILQASNATLKDCQERPPMNAQPLATLEKCVANLKDARERITTLCIEMDGLRGLAWEGAEE